MSARNACVTVSSCTKGMRSKCCNNAGGQACTALCSGKAIGCGFRSPGVCGACGLGFRFRSLGLWLTLPRKESDEAAASHASRCRCSDSARIQATSSRIRGSARRTWVGKHMHTFQDLSTCFVSIDEDVARHEAGSLVSSNHSGGHQA